MAVLSQGFRTLMISGERKGFFLKDGFKKLVKRWQKCVEVGGDCVEK
jgi:hypothetical protein